MSDLVVMLDQKLSLAGSISFFALSTDARVEMSIFKAMILLQICLGCPDNPVLCIAVNKFLCVDVGELEPRLKHSC